MKACLTFSDISQFIITKFYLDNTLKCNHGMKIKTTLFSIVEKIYNIRI